MIDYIYKGFKISYEVVNAGEASLNPYKADGMVVYLLNKPQTFAPVKFHTEYESYSGAEYAIKKLLENYVDFELKSFYGLRKEKIC